MLFNVYQSKTFHLIRLHAASCAVHLYPSYCQSFLIWILEEQDLKLIATFTLTFIQYSTKARYTHFFCTHDTASLSDALSLIQMRKILKSCKYISFSMSHKLMLHYNFLNFMFCLFQVVENPSVQILK